MRRRDWVRIAGSLFTGLILVACGGGEDPVPVEADVSFLLPDDGSTVTELRVLAVRGEDVDSVSFEIDGVVQFLDETPPFEWTLDPDVYSEGEHEIAVTVSTSLGTEERLVVQVTLVPPPPPITLDRVEVAPAKESIDRLESAVFTATAFFSDGTSRNVTDEATWTSSDPLVATVSTGSPPRGVVASAAGGTTRITAALSGRSGVTDLSVSHFAGPLRVSTKNSRYFTDNSGEAIYLTGSHTWTNFQDSGTTDPPDEFDYDAYLDWLEDRGHNFFRLWTWENAAWTVWTKGSYYFDPLPYQRTGPGTARDGKLKFDLNKFNQAYFDRLRERVVAAGERGFYVSIMLFNGWSIEDKNMGLGNPWPGHPFHADNNINQIDGDPDGTGEGWDVHSLAIDEVVALHEAYIKKVIDTVNDLDNVLYEISNESPSTSKAWHYQMIDFIHDTEADEPDQHPVGMTVEWRGGSNQTLFDSPAEWISVNGSMGGISNPKETNGDKVILNDTDHLCGICGEAAWAWKSLLRGYYPIFMDAYDGQGTGVGAPSNWNTDATRWVDLRKSLGQTLEIAGEIDLLAMEPNGGLASTGYCLADPGVEYLAYLPSGGAVTIDLAGVSGSFDVEWFNPADGKKTAGGSVSGGASRTLTAPFTGHAVVHLK